MNRSPRKFSMCDFVLFGTKGDLARRKLIPSLYQLDKADLLHGSTKIIGTAKDQFSLDEYRQKVQAALEEFVAEDLPNDILQRFLDRLVYVSMDFTDQNAYKNLQKIRRKEAILLNYLATPPAVYQAICHGLHQAGMIDKQARVILEKPIGFDLESSKQINDAVARFFDESQIYRIDHYLGKETVQNLIALRFANSIFASKWDNRTIDHVQITVAEEVGIEGRWDYFDQAGQMRDMVQNHLLQILSLVAMDPPVNLDADSIRDEKVKVLKSLRPIQLESVHETTVRGQYESGFIHGSKVTGYVNEQGSNPQSETETFVALKVDIDNWRWAGVPFYLRSGKRMPQKVSEIVVYFKNPPHNLYKDSYRKLPENKLTIRLQPDEGIDIQMLNKQPGLSPETRLQAAKLDLNFSETFNTKRVADAYERLLLEAMQGNQSLFVRRDEIEQAWAWVDGIIDAWQKSDEQPKLYPAGSWGPVASIALISQDGRMWDE